ncbi:MAG: hypothetical protein OHK0039_34520 [Bacteroidia bacterium]
MERKLLPVLVLLLSSLGLYAQSERTCHAMDLLELQLQAHPEQARAMQQIEDFTQRYVATHTHGSRAVITIPVVVHVVYNNSTENISTAQIQSQIDVLNADFRRLNSDANNTWSQAADTEIEFCLASVDPSGNATTGITRTSTTRTSFSYTNDNVKFTSSGGKDAWPAGNYLNMWVCDLGSGLLGYAQFPGGSATTDGVVIDYAYFGTLGTATAPFNLGRTATHEVGHWLNLRHIWGDGGCSVDDFVTDTPTSDAPNYGCAVGHVSCSTVDMVQNYMDYSDDACMNLFTAGQKSRMNALFAPGGARASLLSSNGCGGTPPPPAEICDNGIDDDGDGQIDCADGDCASAQVCQPTGTCNAPTNLVDIVASTRRSATLSWSAVTGAQSYFVELRRVGTTTWSTGTTINTSITASVARNRNYEWRVTSNCANGQTATSVLSTFNTFSAGRYGEPLAPLTVYPNPSDNVLTLEFGELDHEVVQVRIVDMAGRTVWTQTVDTLEGYIDVDTRSFESGLYFVVMQDGDTRHVVKLSVMH